MPVDLMLLLPAIFSGGPRVSGFDGYEGAELETAKKP